MVKTLYSILHRSLDLTDLKELQSFIVDYNKNNKSNSKKIKRFEIVLNYLYKLKLGD